MNTTELFWFKSSYSGSDGDECVEVALSWHKSSRSLNEDAACPGAVHVRDSKDKQGPQLALTPTVWTTFVSFAASR
jgi:hypothetical protein